MASFLGELKRRNVVKVAVAYAIVAWLVIQIAATVFPVLQIPDWAVAFVTMLLLLGFPIALTLSWAYELTPDGVVRTDPVNESSQPRSRRLAVALVASLILALGWIGYRELGPVAESQQVLSNSVAVLPFDNLSPNPDDAFFAAGIHEEVLNQLEKIRDLSVISRTSVLRYSESRPSIPEIGRTLNVQSVMEGSVRFADNRVRIAAQLIDAATDEHLWSEIYERELSDVFAIQADIAMNIANAVGAEFSLAEQESISTPLTESTEAYDAYLRAITSIVDIAPLMDESEVVAFHRFLDDAIAADPGFAEAHALKAIEYAFASIRTYPLAQAEVRLQRPQRAQEEIDSALASNPNLGSAHGALGVLNMVSRRGPEALVAYERALQLSPNDLNAVTDFAVFSAQWGRHEDADRLIRRAIELAPDSPTVLSPAGFIFLLGRNYELAAQTNRTVTRLVPSVIIPYPLLGISEAKLGNEAEALEALRFSEELLQTLVGPDQLAQTAYGYWILGLEDDARRIFDQLQQTAENYYVGPGSWAAAYLSIGEYERALEWLERAANVREPDEGFIILSLLGENALANPILERAEFADVRARLGYTLP